MKRTILLYLFIFGILKTFAQDKAFAHFLADSSVRHASVSFSLADTKDGESVFEYRSGISLVPASVLKLVTTAAALEILGPEHTFKTTLGYSGTLKRGTLYGDIIIKGGGDPALGSDNFGEHYSTFPGKWISDISRIGIKKIKGRIITDDSYFDYEPVPGKWLWEDIGNYYGSGAYGLSVYDNSFDLRIHSSGDTSARMTLTVSPGENNVTISNRMIITGNRNEGSIFSSPYSTEGWITGTVSETGPDPVYKGSISDPPLLLAKIIDNEIRDSGIQVRKAPSTTRISQDFKYKGFTPVSEIESPPVEKIIEVLNHKSVNLYSEHLLKEMGKVVNDTGSVSSGLDVIYKYLDDAGINTSGIYLTDGSGLSPQNSITSEAITDLLCFIKNKGKYFSKFVSSLPVPGEEGTLKDSFRSSLFISRLYAKTGSMTRVRSLAGYIHTAAGNDLAFCIIINNFTGPPAIVTEWIEKVVEEIIMNR